MIGGGGSVVEGLPPGARRGGQRADLSPAVTSAAPTATRAATTTASVDGVCEFDVSVCANSTFNPACTLNGVQDITVEHAARQRRPEVRPRLPGPAERASTATSSRPSTTADDCTTPVTLRVPIKGPLGIGNHCGPRRKKIRITTRSQVDRRAGRHRPRHAEAHLPAGRRTAATRRMLFGSTFDRIQQQVFNQNCALSGCHDSQTPDGRPDARDRRAYDNLVNHVPKNPAAIDAGLAARRRRSRAEPRTRASSTTRSRATCPTHAYGERMPLGKPKLQRARCARSSGCGSRPAHRRTGWVRRDVLSRERTAGECDG